MIRFKFPYLNLSLSQAENLLNDKEFRLYAFAWKWSAPRFSGLPGIIQEEYYNKYGSKKYYARINRIRAWFNLKPYENTIVRS